MSFDLDKWNNIREIRKRGKKDTNEMNIGEIEREIKSLEKDYNDLMEICKNCPLFNISGGCVGCDIKKMKEDIREEIEKLKKELKDKVID
jgi:deoxyadenosine/deoxycytidine kinase